MKVIKKDGTIEQFDGQKIVNAVSKSATRAMIELDDTQYHEIVSKVMAIVTERFPEQVHVADMHNIVEQVLDEVNPKIAKSYRDYRNFKKDFVHIMDEDRKVNAQKFETAFYAKPDLRNVRPPEERAKSEPATLDLESLVEQLQKSPELASALAALIAAQAPTK